MNYPEYRKLVAELSLGKKLQDSIYLHRSAITIASPELAKFTDQILSKLQMDTVLWNIAKFFRRDFKLTLLNYPDFDSNSYPSLAQSHTIHLDKLSFRTANYNVSKNPPILHRKETFILENDPRYSEFLAITKEGEDAGLYENTKIIGFKQAWERVIRKKGYELIDGHIEKRINTPIDKLIHNNHSVTVQRHRTAINRYGLSTPMQSLANHDYFNGNYSIFDFGCGKGDDLRELQAHGIEANGWDPVFDPESPKNPADIINLGFVINVIEDPKERKKSLKQAYQLANKFLVVSVMLGNYTITEKYQPYKDGVITNRKTFQKYYSQQEIRNYLEQSLSASPIAVGPGIFYVFKDELEEQRFLSNRQSRKRD